MGSDDMIGNEQEQAGHEHDHGPHDEIRDWLETNLRKIIVRAMTTGPDGPDAETLKSLHQWVSDYNTHDPITWLMEAMDEHQLVRVAVDFRPGGPEWATMLCTNDVELASKTFLVNCCGRTEERKQKLLSCMAVICLRSGARMQIFDANEDPRRRGLRDPADDSPTRRIR